MVILCENNMIKKSTNWIKRHQVAAFFMITFGITWGLGFTYDAILNQGKDLLMPLAAVATCGPALAGIIVSRICNTEPKSGAAKAPWIAFLIALILSTSVFIAHNAIVNHTPVSLGLIIFIPIFSVPVAYVLSAAYSRVPSVRQYLASLIQARGVWGWMLLACVVLAGLGVLSIVISNMLGRQSIHPSALPFKGWTLAKMVVITFLYQFFFFNGTGEEIGWRGFALPRLQARTSPLIAGLVLTFFWAAWHVFFWKAGGEPVSTWRYWQETFIRLFPATMLINWFYNHSRGSILVAGVTHAAGNTVFAYMPRVDWTVHTALGYVFVLVIILTDRMWRKLPAESPATYRTEEQVLLVKGEHL